MSVYLLHNKLNIEYEFHQGENGQAIVIFHPHPLYEGTMMNKVITTSSIAAKQLGYSFLRFNYPGVGNSDGYFGFGYHEACQALGLMSEIINEPIKYLIGFSFGCNVIQYVWQQQKEKTPTIWIGASINETLSSLSELSSVKGWIHGEVDLLCPYSKAMLFAKEKNIQLHGVSKADHFFNGQQIVLRETLKELIV